MSPNLKSFLIKVAKQAVNAALVSLGPVFATPNAYNLTTTTGLEHVGFLVIGAVGAREILVWVPVLIKWSQSD